MLTCIDFSVPTPSPFFSRQALAYDGPAYRGLDAKTFSQEEWAFGAGCIRLLSGLYGVLRPTDLIQPYRLEMGSRFGFVSSSRRQCIALIDTSTI